jgi:hypothetical protein
MTRSASISAGYKTFFTLKSIDISACSKVLQQEIGQKAPVTGDSAFAQTASHKRLTGQFKKLRCKTYGFTISGTKRSPACLNQAYQFLGLVSSAATLITGCYRDIPISRDRSKDPHRRNGANKKLTMFFTIY